MSSATARNRSSEAEDQEFELTLGNKAMLTVFFVVVFLLGIFFAMGYVVGRNSPAVEIAANDAETYENSNAPSAVRSVPATTESTIEEVQAPVAVPALTVTRPEVGRTYLQVIAVAKPEAEVLAEVLIKKGFRAIVAPGPNERAFRVLVGPAGDVGDASKLKTDLEAAGFKPFVRKY